MAVFIAACDGAEQQPGFGGPSVLIIAPEDGAVINTGDLVDIHSRISDPEGATDFFLVVNNEPVRQDQFTTPMRSGSIYQPWQPLEPGTYSR